MALMNTHEVAELLRTPAETVRYWRTSGRGPKHFKIGRRVVYDRAEVEAWLAQQKAAAS